RPACRRRLRAEPAERDRAAARPSPALAGGRPHAAGLRRRRRLAEGAHRGHRRHEYRPLPDPADRPAARRRGAARWTGRAVPRRRPGQERVRPRPLRPLSHRAVWSPYRSPRKEPGMPREPVSISDTAMLNWHALPTDADDNVPGPVWKLLTTDRQ